MHTPFSNDPATDVFVQADFTPEQDVDAAIPKRLGLIFVCKEVAFGEDGISYGEDYQADETQRKSLHSRKHTVGWLSRTVCELPRDQRLVPAECELWPHQEATVKVGEAKDLQERGHG
uniref:Uncharacterized protein n=1 Tax=Anguilla anguilla TaxID=7936 RepID=A0A0E9WJ28_ANGAN